MTRVGELFYESHRLEGKYWTDQMLVNLITPGIADEACVSTPCRPLAVSRVSRPKKRERETAADVRVAAHYFRFLGA